MDAATKSIVQQRVNDIPSFWNKKIHGSPETPTDFRPWTCGLSPSALYNCSLSCRKRMNIKTPEVKWMSIKRWVQTTPLGIQLPEGVFLSIKRHETYISDPKPHFTKLEYILLMFPYGNVWSQQSPEIPITEDWIWSSVENMLILEALIRKDAAHPIIGYFKSSYDYMVGNPDQIGIHLKRKKKND